MTSTCSRANTVATHNPTRHHVFTLILQLPPLPRAFSRPIFSHERTSLGNRAKLLATSLLLGILTNRAVVLAEKTGGDYFGIGEFFDVPCFGTARGWQIDYEAPVPTSQFPRGESAAADYAAYKLTATDHVESWSDFKQVRSPALPPPSTLSTLLNSRSLCVYVYCSCCYLYVLFLR